MPGLILRPSGLSPEKGKPWSLQLRYHESYGEVEYCNVANVSESIACEIIRAGAAYWLFGEPEPATPTALAKSQGQGRSALQPQGETDDR